MRSIVLAIACLFAVSVLVSDAYAGAAPQASRGNSAEARAGCVDVAPLFKAGDSTPTKISRLEEALKGYSTFFPSLYSSMNRRYEICFPEGAALDIAGAPEDFDGGFELGDARNGLDVYIGGLKVTGAGAKGSERPILKISDAGGRHIVIDKSEFRNVASGVLVEGNGRIEILKSSVTGIGSGDCFTVRAPGAVLAGITASSCREGVRIEASNVKIAGGSRICDNRIGVHVTDGFRGTIVEQSLVYGNFDGQRPAPARLSGILFDSGILRDLQFYSVKDGKVVQSDPASESVIVYEDGPAYILTPEEPGADARIDLYLTGGDCQGSGDAHGQACGFADGFSVKTEELDKNGVVKLALPPAYRGKRLVAIYTDTELGSSAISQTFSIAAQVPVVAIVASPYDIAASGESGVVLTEVSALEIAR